jgi:hypothetical protein
VVNRFDAELARGLRPVGAPDRLWDCVEARLEAADAIVYAPVRWPLWALAVAVAATIAVFCFTLRSDTTSYMAKLAAGELSQKPGVEFRSGDPAEIRAWVKAKAGLEIALPAERSVELVGVSLIRGMACVSYRVGKQEGKLLVARGGPAAPQHPRMEHAVYRGAALSSWALQGQSYALAWPGPQDSHGACVLCHVD